MTYLPTFASLLVGLVAAGLIHYSDLSTHTQRLYDHYMARWSAESTLDPVQTEAPDYDRRPKSARQRRTIQAQRVHHGS